MNTILRYLLATILCTFMLSTHAAVGDDSYDPDPAKLDLDMDAQFDVYSLLSLLISSTGSMTAQQNFENGFTNGQVLNSWVALGSTRMRFGFGESLDQIQWQSVVGQIDPGSSAYGLNHPMGTYGNALGVNNDPRNYIADHYFLSSGKTTASNYFVVQTEQPVSFIGFTMNDYASGVGGTFKLRLLSGNSLLDAQDIPNVRNTEGTVDAGVADGSFRGVIGSSPLLDPARNLRTPFNFLVMRLDTPDATVGFDNFIVGIAPVPEPEVWSMMMIGLGFLFFAGRRRKLLS